MGFISNFQDQIEQQKMGQGNCCEQRSALNNELIIDFHSLKTEDPVESELPYQAKRSIKQKTLICHRGFDEGVDGDYVTEGPMVTEAAYDTLQNLESKDISETYNFERGSQQRGYFRFRRTGIVYQGEWKVAIKSTKDERPHGYGKNYYPNGGIYEGVFFDGVPHGYGIFIMPSGEYYQGQVKFGRANGVGTYQSESSTYKGGFKDNEKHGEGEEKGDGFFFQGEFEYGEKKKGLFKYDDCTYEGEFVDSLFSGKAKLTTSEGRYQGQFKEGKLNGRGQFHWLNGSIFRGQYYRGLRQGFGQYFNGKKKTISRGIWKKGSLNGDGQYTEYMGQCHKCVWAEGKIVAILGK